MGFWLSRPCCNQSSFSCHTSKRTNRGLWDGRILRQGQNRPQIGLHGLARLKSVSFCHDGKEPLLLGPVARETGSTVVVSVVAGLMSQGKDVGLDIKPASPASAAEDDVIRISNLTPYSAAAFTEARAGHGLEQLLVFVRHRPHVGQVALWGLGASCSRIGGGPWAGARLVNDRHLAKCRSHTAFRSLRSRSHISAAWSFSIVVSSFLAGPE